MLLAGMTALPVSMYSSANMTTCDRAEDDRQPRGDAVDAVAVSLLQPCEPHCGARGLRHRVQVGPATFGIRFAEGLGPGVAMVRKAMPSRAPAGAGGRADGDAAGEPMWRPGRKTATTPGVRESPGGKAPIGVGAQVPLGLGDDDLDGRG